MSAYYPGTEVHWPTPPRMPQAVGLSREQRRGVLVIGAVCNLVMGLAVLIGTLALLGWLLARALQNSPGLVGPGLRPEDVGWGPFGTPDSPRIVAVVVTCSALVWLVVAAASLLHLRWQGISRPWTVAVAGLAIMTTAELAFVVVTNKASGVLSRLLLPYQDGRLLLVSGVALYAVGVSIGGALLYWRLAEWTCDDGDQAAPVEPAQ